MNDWHSGFKTFVINLISVIVCYRGYKTSTIILFCCRLQQVAVLRLLAAMCMLVHLSRHHYLRQSKQWTRIRYYHTTCQMLLMQLSTILVCAPVLHVHVKCHFVTYLSEDPRTQFFQMLQIPRHTMLQLCYHVYYVYIITSFKDF